MSGARSLHVWVSSYLGRKKVQPCSSICTCALGHALALTATLLQAGLDLQLEVQPPVIIYLHPTNRTVFATDEHPKGTTESCSYFVYMKTHFYYYFLYFGIVDEDV